MRQKPFEVSRVRGAPVSDSDLLADLQRVADAVGSQKITLGLYGEHGRFDSSTLERRFGTWNLSLRAAGLVVSNRVNLPDDQLFENILRLWQHYGRQPRKAELSRPPSTISQGPYRRRFRSWIDALESFVAYANAAEPSDDGAPTALPPAARPLTGRDPSLRLRFRVLRQDRFCCRQCGASPATQPGVELQVDHIRPWSLGGESVPENLQTLCARCNLGKSNADVVVP